MTNRNTRAWAAFRRKWRPQRPVAPPLRWHYPLLLALVAGPILFGGVLSRNSAYVLGLLELFPTPEAQRVAGAAPAALVGLAVLVNVLRPSSAPSIPWLVGVMAGSTATLLSLVPLRRRRLYAPPSLLEQVVPDLKTAASISALTMLAVVVPVLLLDAPRRHAARAGLRWGGDEADPSPARPTPRVWFAVAIAVAIPVAFATTVFSAGP